MGRFCLKIRHNLKMLAHHIQAINLILLSWHIRCIQLIPLQSVLSSSEVRGGGICSQPSVATSPAAPFFSSRATWVQIGKRQLVFEAAAAPNHYVGRSITFSAGRILLIWFEKTIRSPSLSSFVEDRLFSRLSFVAYLWVCFCSLDSIFFTVFPISL